MVTFECEPNIYWLIYLSLVIPQHPLPSGHDNVSGLRGRECLKGDIKLFFLEFIVLLTFLFLF